MPVAAEVKVLLRSFERHPKALAFLRSDAKRRIVRAGRRGAKTVAAATLALERFLAGGRVLYAAPTQEQVETFWWEVKRALADAIQAGIYYKNESLHIIELPPSKQRIRAKTAWNADTLRGDYADVLILDEWQLMNEDAWERVGAPMLLDNDGDAVFIYTPPSLASRSVSKARDPRHAAKMYAMAQADPTGRWGAFTWTSHDNPYISVEALEGITQDMTALAIRQEIGAEDIEDVPGALWSHTLLDSLRVTSAPSLTRIVIAIDPAVTSTEQSDETGIVVAGIGENHHGYVLADLSGTYSPAGWAERALKALDDYKADRIVAEDNNGGEMVEFTLRVIRPGAPLKRVHASRGKAARAEPVAARYEQGQVHHVGIHRLLEDQLCSWNPLSTARSPDRLDALVWGMTELLFGGVHGRIMPGL